MPALIHMQVIYPVKALSTHEVDLFEEKNRKEDSLMCKTFLFMIFLA